MPTKIGRFEIQAEISRSSTGSVNKACDPTGGQIVALKVVDLKPFGEKAPPMVKRILEEAESSKLLNTHNIAMLFGAGEIEGNFCATMEYVQGNSISTMLERKEVFSIWDVQDIARQCCQGLDHARVNKVLHYSLEPEKVMVQWDGIVKMLGFGVSMMGTFAAQCSSGTPKILHYMSPEQLQGQPLDASSNLFSLGAILYEMVTQHKAFEGESADQVGQSVLEITPAPPSQVNPKIDPGLSEVIMKALSKAPPERYQSGQELINDLEKCKNNPIKSAPANKTVQPSPGFKAAQVKQSPQCVSEPEKKVAASSVLSAPTGSPAQTSIPAPLDVQASAAAAGAEASAPTLKSLRAAKLDSSQQFITTCVKASIDAVTKTEAKMSSAVAELEIKTPKIAVDPMMDESAKARGSQARSFSEIDELPPLKEVYVAVPLPHVDADDVFLDDPQLPSVTKSGSDQSTLPVREIAKKAVTEIKKTPPMMFLYSIGAAVAVILAIAALISFRIHSESAEDESSAQNPSVASSTASSSTNTNGPNGQGSAISQSSMQLPIASGEQHADTSSISVKGKYPAKKKARATVTAPAPPVIIPAELMVNSNPAGAQVQVDGRSDPNWITPYNISGLTPGQHTVYISKAGFATEIRTLDAISGGKSTVMIHFNQLPATVFFVSAPAGATILVDDKDTGRVTPAQVSLDKPGSHTFTVRKQGFLEETSTANLAPGQTFHYSPTLIALGSTDEIKPVGKLKKFFGSSDPVDTGIVSIKILPKGAQIAVNSRLLEKASPADFYLNPGTYVVDVALTGYKSARHVISVTRGGKVTLDETLERQ
jgi:serine/threonine protein kinase